MKERKPERSFPFLRVNQREAKPRKRGVTEIRGPYYSAVGRRYLEELLEMMGAHVDSLKFAGGSFTLMPRAHFACAIASVRVVTRLIIRISSFLRH